MRVYVGSCAIFERPKKGEQPLTSSFIKSVCRQAYQVHIRRRRREKRVKARAYFLQFAQAKYNMLRNGLVIGKIIIHGNPWIVYSLGKH